MELYLQFGYGMKSLTIELAKKWGGVSVILSPRDMTPSQLESWSYDFKRVGVHTFFDPQCYFPKSRLERLSLYDYWDNGLMPTASFGNDVIDDTIQAIKKYNDIAETKGYFLPCIMNQYDQHWESKFFFQTRRFIDAAKRIMDDKPLYATLALPKDLLLQNESLLEPIIQEIIELDVNGYYVIAETIERKYLVDNPIWLSNILHICATLKLYGKKVIFGYGNHQLLPLALLGVDGLASGTWLNVRSFTNRFVIDKESKRKSTWIYYPKSLSEYKMPFMDWAKSIDVLKTMIPEDTEFLNDSIKKMFESDALPSMTGFNETDAFKHYLWCLRHQIHLLERKSYREAFSSYEIMLEVAEREIERLEKAGVYAQARSFRDVIDVNRAAITQLDRSHGFQLEMSWPTL